MQEDSMTDKKELFDRLDRCRKEITELRRSLNQLDEQKENWF